MHPASTDLSFPLSTDLALLAAPPTANSASNTLGTYPALSQMSFPQLQQQFIHLRMEYDRLSQQNQLNIKERDCYK